MSKGINNRQFVDFLNDMESAHGDMHYCMEVHWLYCGCMVCRSETKLFLELRGKPLLQLCSHYKMWYFAFCINHLIYTYIHTWMDWADYETTRRKSQCQWNVWQNNSVQEEGSVVGSEDVIKQYDTLPSTEDGKAYRFMEEIQLLQQQFNFHFQDMCMYIWSTIHLFSVAFNVFRC
jgi:hypothetical protein